MLLRKLKRCTKVLFEAGFMVYEFAQYLAIENEPVVRATARRTRFHLPTGMDVLVIGNTTLVRIKEGRLAHYGVAPGQCLRYLNR
jgi:SPX domain protein involved in polyphosphate accumulation